MRGEIDELQLFQRLIANYDAPAFMRRAQRVEAAWELLLRRCDLKRQEWLTIAKLRLGVLFALAGNVETIRPHVEDPACADELSSLHAAWQPRLRLPVAPATSPKPIRHALQQVAASFARFNRRWETFVAELDLTQINALRDGYNRYYVMEKECAVRSARVARAGFVPLSPATLDDIWARFPRLVDVRVR
jgi:hypothetical protein